MRSSKPSIAELRPVAQPPGLLERRSAEHWAGRWYMRRLSVYVTWLLVRAGFSANGVTATMIGVGLAAAAVLSFDGLLPAVVAALLVQLYLLLDCSDGEVARWRATESIAGIYLDRLGHYTVEAAIIVAIGGRVARTEGLAWLVWGLVGGILVLLEKAETDLVDVARHRGGRAVVSEGAAVMRSAPLAAGRRVAAFVPLHRATHAVEASLLALAAAVVDQVADSSVATRVLLVTLVVTSGAVVVLHLVSVLSSRRLVDP
jgi:hypothetical protein